jgi:hypothetical protein
MKQFLIGEDEWIDGLVRGRVAGEKGEKGEGEKA